MPRVWPAAKLDLVDWARVASLGAFSASLVLPCLRLIYRRYGDDYSYVLWGWEIASYGWMGIVEGVFAWYANPLLVLSLALTRIKPRAALAVAATAFALACSGLFVRTFWNEPQREIVEGFAIGGYVWLASFLAAIVAALGAALRPHAPT